MAVIRGTDADEFVDPDFKSPTVTGGLPSAAVDDIDMGGGNDEVDAGGGNDLVNLGAGNDLFHWSINDLFDNLNGGAGFDEMRINGGSGNLAGVNLSGPSPGVFLFRDMAGSAQGGVDFSGIERIRVIVGENLGGISISSNIALSGVQEILVDYLAATGGGLNFFGDGQYSVISQGGATTIAFGSVRVEASRAPHQIFFIGGGGASLYDFSAAEVPQLTLVAAQGAEYVIAGASIESLLAAGGLDTVDYSHSPAAVFLLREAGDTRAFGFGGWAEGDSFDGVDTIIGSPFGDYVRVVGPDAITFLAGDGDDQAVGGSTHDRFFGEAGNDRLSGGGGNDVLDGGLGADLLTGGSGDDWFVVRDAADLVFEDAGTGNDRVFAYASWTLNAGAAVETLSAYNDSVSDAINLTGNALAQTIYGTAGTNMLDGGGGGDALAGFGGDDWYVVRNGGDRVFENVSAGNDRVFTYVSWALTAGAVVETLSTYNAATSEAIELVGNEFGQTIYGNAGANRIDGKHGSDILFGDVGADIYAFTSALGVDNVDRMFGFEPGIDKIGFAGISQASLAAGAFRVGTQAFDNDDRIIYDRATGALYYDGDGVGGAAQVLFAIVQGGPPILASDFITI